jgi:CarD family transcriptional regulator
VRTTRFSAGPIPGATSTGGTGALSTCACITSNALSPSNGFRPVATSSEIEEVFDILREKDVHIDKQTWNRRYRGFMEKIKTGSLFDVAEVYRDLYRLKSSKVLSFGERKMLDNAKQLIVKELAVAKKWAEEKVEQELEKACA